MFKFINWILGRRVPSKELYKFYCEWLEWAESGGEPHPIFMRWCGLCQNLFSYSIDYGDKIDKELKREFKSNGMSPVYPFGKGSYHLRAVDETMHTDPYRLAWVRERIAVYEEYHKK